MKVPLNSAESGSDGSSDASDENTNQQVYAICCYYLPLGGLLFLILNDWDLVVVEALTTHPRDWFYSIYEHSRKSDSLRDNSFSMLAWPMESIVA